MQLNYELWLHVSPRKSARNKNDVATAGVYCLHCERMSLPFLRQGEEQHTLENMPGSGTGSSPGEEVDKVTAMTQTEVGQQTGTQENERVWKYMLRIFFKLSKKKKKNPENSLEREKRLSSLLTCSLEVSVAKKMRRRALSVFTASRQCSLLGTGFVGRRGARWEGRSWKQESLPLAPGHR